MRRLALLLGFLCSAVWAQAGQPAPVPTSRLDDKVIQDAIKATVAEMPKLPPPDAKADFSAGASAPGTFGTSQAAIDRAFEDAAVESCWGGGALKHNPPVVSVAGVPIVLGGLLALPHVFYAAANGKCK